jgi:hypothetical protein
MASGLDDFKRLLREFRGLSVWAVGGSLVVPFAAALVDLSPPWPKGIVPVTAVVELLSLVLVFQFLNSRRAAERGILAGVAVFALSSVVYLAALSHYTYEVPTTKARFVKGYECTADAKAVFKERCPDLGLDELRTAEYEAARLWTHTSITVTRTSLAVLWLASFIALSFALGSFLWHQMRKKGRGEPGGEKTAAPGGRRKKAVEETETLP